MRRILVMIASDDVFSRSGIRQTLSLHNAPEILDVVDCDPGEDASDAMARIAHHSPDVLLLDLGHASTHRLELCRKVTRNLPGTKVIVLSSKPAEDDEEMFEAIKSGAVAYLGGKQCTPDELAEAIRRAADGEYPINDSVLSRPELSWRVLREFQEFAAIGKHAEEITAPLTAREVQVLTLISEGNSNKQIAGILGTSEQTIKNHVSAVLRKLNANDRAHAVYIAARDGLLSVDAAPGAETDSPRNERRLPLTKQTLRNRFRPTAFTG
jgi:DNA-binding NarL/FixJ family response regulator